LFQSRARYRAARAGAPRQNITRRATGSGAFAISDLLEGALGGPERFPKHSKSIV
jgi:hypothetical protein